jgi:hypothetical protein
MPAYALIKIKRGALISQDFRVGTWPACCPPRAEHNGERKQFTLYPDAVFIGEKSVSRGKVFWECKRAGYGLRHEYGNGQITVHSGDVEMLTPLLGYEPSLPSEPAEPPPPDA